MANMANNTSYYVTDKDLDELAKKIVSDLYNNKDIVDLKNNGRQIIGNLSMLIERNLSGIYSNITGHKSLQNILINAIRYSVLIEKNMILDAEFKHALEACDRRKNMLNIYTLKLSEDKNNQTLIADIEKTTEEIKLLEKNLNEITEKNSEPPIFKKQILELAKKTYKLLLRNDKTAEKLYTAVCVQLNVKLDPCHFGYYQRQQYNNDKNFNTYERNYTQDRPDRYMPGERSNREEKKDIYIPQQLQTYRRY